MLYTYHIFMSNIITVSLFHKEIFGLLNEYHIYDRESTEAAKIKRFRPLR